MSSEPKFPIFDAAHRRNAIARGYLSQRKWDRSEIASIFNVPPHMLGEREALPCDLSNEYDRSVFYGNEASTET